jgi:hypothetical protein
MCPAALLESAQVVIFTDQGLYIGLGCAVRPWSRLVALGLCRPSIEVTEYQRPRAIIGNRCANGRKPGACRDTSEPAATAKPSSTPFLMSAHPTSGTAETSCPSRSRSIGRGTSSSSSILPPLAAYPAESVGCWRGNAARSRAKYGLVPCAVAAMTPEAAVASRICSSVSGISWRRSRRLAGSTQRSNATRNTAMPASAARIADAAAVRHPLDTRPPAPAIWGPWTL